MNPVIIILDRLLLDVYLYAQSAAKGHSRVKQNVFLPTFSLYSAEHKPVLILYPVIISAVQAGVYIELPDSYSHLLYQSALFLTVSHPASMKHLLSDRSFISSGQLVIHTSFITFCLFPSSIHSVNRKSHFFLSTVLIDNGDWKRIKLKLSC